MPCRPFQRAYIRLGGPRAKPSLDVCWMSAGHFDIEHTYRFSKNTLGWTNPAVRTPEQADRWTLLIVAAYTQLRLARGLVDDCVCLGNGPARQPSSPRPASAGGFVDLAQPWALQPVRRIRNSGPGRPKAPADRHAPASGLSQFLGWVVGWGVSPLLLGGLGECVDERVGDFRVKRCWG
jgi:hypothetical protein